MASFKSFHCLSQYNISFKSTVWPISTVFCLLGHTLMADGTYDRGHKNMHITHTSTNEVSIQKNRLI